MGKFFISEYENYMIMIVKLLVMSRNTGVTPYMANYNLLQIDRINKATGAALISNKLESLEG